MLTTLSVRLSLDDKYSLMRLIACWSMQTADPSRRRSYDQLRSSNQSRTSQPSASGSYWDYFGAGKGAEEEEEYENERPDAEHVFGETFEDLLRPEVNRVVPLWTWAGAGAGAVLGFVSTLSYCSSRQGIEIDLELLFPVPHSRSLAISLGLLSVDLLVLDWAQSEIARVRPSTRSLRS